MSKSSLVGRAIIVDNHGMTGGDFSNALFKIAHRKATPGHYIAQKLVRLSHSTTRVVSESRLNFSPGSDKLSTIRWGENADIQGLRSFLGHCYWWFQLLLPSTEFRAAIIASVT
jgi:hypothetical protein